MLIYLLKNIWSFALQKLLIFFGKNGSFFANNSFYCLNYQNVDLLEAQLNKSMAAPPEKESVHNTRSNNTCLLASLVLDNWALISFRFSNSKHMRQNLIRTASLKGYSILQHTLTICGKSLFNPQKVK